VRIIEQFAAGGTTAILARNMASELTKAFGQSFIVENRAGAGGNIGADLVAKSAPDGYMILMGSGGQGFERKGRLGDRKRKSPDHGLVFRIWNHRDINTR